MSSEPAVFVVDDDVNALASLRWLLETEGIPVRTFSSAAEFLESYDPDSIACLILDMRMPGMGGLELQIELVARGTPPPIIFLSGFGDVRHCAAAMKGGAVDFLEKPVSDDQLLGVVRAALKEGQQRRLGGTSDPEVAARVEKLTPREHDVMDRIYQGDTIKMIATKFGISFQTVAKHRTRVFEKLQVKNEVELVRLLTGIPVCRTKVVKHHSFGRARYSHAAAR